MQMRQLRRKRGFVGYFDSAHVIEISRAIEIETDAVELRSDLFGDLSEAHHCAGISSMPE